MESRQGRTVKQKPMGTATPREPPTAGVAKSYLDEITAIERRREGRIDRRMLGWLHMIDGLVVGSLSAAALFVIATDESIGYLWLLVIFELMIWMEISGELRDRIGARPQWFRSWSLPYLLVFVPTILIVWWSSLIVRPSLLLALVPFGISVLVFGVLAAGQWRRASGQNLSGDMPAPEPFTRGAAIATAVVGTLLGVLVVVATGVVEPTAATAIAAILLGVLGVFTIAVQTGTWIPALGRVWLWPQWTALVVAGAMFLASLLLGASTRIITLPGAVVMGAFVLMLFIAVAMWGVRRSAMTHRRCAAELERRI